MMPVQQNVRWVVSEPSASAFAKKIATINKHAWDLLARLEETQVIDLIIMIEESIENFSSLLIKPEFGKVSSLELFKGFYNSMTRYIDEESFDEYDVPEDLDVLQVFAAFAASKASYAMEFLAGRNVTAAHVEKFGTVEAAASALAADATIEAAEALVVGYAEFKRMHEFLTDEELEDRREKIYHVRATKGGVANSDRFQPLREKALQLYDDLVANNDAPIGHFTAAGRIQSALYDFAVEIGFIKKAEPDTVTQETIYRWLSGAKKKEEWQAIFARMHELDTE